MSNSESFSEREPNAFSEESSDGLFDSDSEAVGPDAGDGSDTDVEILGESPSSVPSHGIGNGLMTAPVPLSIIYSNGRHVGLAMPGETSVGRQSVTSTSSREELAAEPSSRPRGIGVDYLEPNRITEREIAKYRAEYFIPDSIRMRIRTATESLSKLNEGEVVFFTDILLQGVRLPLQPAVQRILAQIGYAPGQFNPNFWVALMGVVTAFGMAGEGAPSYKQFSHLYSVTKSKSADHGGKLKQPSATQAEIRQIERVRLKVSAVERVYLKFLFTPNLIKAQLVNPAEMTEEMRDAEAKRMNESSKQGLMFGLQGKKKKSRQLEVVPASSGGVAPEDQTIADR
ncbi:unnamed protein product [Prunus armeniaca]